MGLLPASGALAAGSGIGETDDMGHADYEITPLGVVAAGSDIQAILHSGDERALHALWDTHHHNEITRRALDDLSSNEAPLGTADLDTTVRALQRDLEAHVPVTAAEALEANRRLAGLLVGRRWIVVRAGRESGESWKDLAAALAMSEQELRDWYTAKITEQEGMPGHQVERSRAVLDD